MCNWQNEVRRKRIVATCEEWAGHRCRGLPWRRRVSGEWSGLAAPCGSLRLAVLFGVSLCALRLKAKAAVAPRRLGRDICARGPGFAPAFSRLPSNRRKATQGRRGEIQVEVGKSSRRSFALCAVARALHCSWDFKALKYEKGPQTSKQADRHPHRGWTCRKCQHWQHQASGRLIHGKSKKQLEEAKKQAEKPRSQTRKKIGKKRKTKKTT